MQFPISFARGAAVAAVLALCTSWALAAFPAADKVSGSDLKLNGEGIRYKAIFKVYEMGLYLPQKVQTADQLMSLQGPKKIVFKALRDLPGTDLGVAFMKGLSANNPKALVSKHLTSTNRLIEVFSGKPKLIEGDSFAMEFTPGKGTQFFITGEPQGNPIGDEEFFRMVLRIWVGASPADQQLKEQLLSGGGSAAARSTETSIY